MTSDDENDDGSLRACDSCRLKKIKCDKKDPCGYCSSRHLNCLRTMPDARKRKRSSSESDVQARLDHIQSQLDKIMSALTAARAMTIPYSPPRSEHESVSIARQSPASASLPSSSYSTFSTSTEPTAKYLSIVPSLEAHGERRSESQPDAFAGHFANVKVLNPLVTNIKGQLQHLAMASLPSMSIEAQLLTAALHEERDTSNEMNCISSVTNAEEDPDYEKNAITMNDTVTQQQRTDIGMRDARANLESQCPAMKALLIAPLDCVASIPANTFRACKENVATPESPVACAEEAPGVHQLVSDSPVSSFISRSTEGSAEIPGDQVSSGNPFHEALDKRDKLQMCDKVLGEKDQNSFRSFKAKSTIPFGDANFDCFQTRSVTVRGSERILIHHWTAIFGEMMFGILHSSINPMAEVWIPDAFSNEASFQGMLAYAAAHMAHLRRQGGGTEYTIYKIEAIRCIQKLLNDATAALSDSAVSAILRQISIEDRFGSPTVADLHRTGLFNIIEKKGGLMSLRKSWRLEFLLYWYLITSRPKFYLQDVRHQDLSDDSLNNSGCKDALRLSHSKLLLDRFAEVFSFLHDLKVLTQEGSDRGIPVLPIGMDPANSLLRLFKSAVDSSRGLTHEIVGETCRLASLFYITSVKADSLRLGTNDMEVLSKTLSETQLAWEYSSETLLWVVLRGKGPGLENPRRAQMVQSLMEVAKSLPEHSWSVLKKLLIAFLWGDAQDVVSMYEELLLLVRGMIGNIT